VGSTGSERHTAKRWDSKGGGKTLVAGVPVAKDGERDFGCRAMNDIKSTKRTCRRGIKNGVDRTKLRKESEKKNEAQKRAGCVNEGKISERKK